MGQMAMSIMEQQPTGCRYPNRRRDNMLKQFWNWFYTELPAYYSIPIIAFLVAAIVGLVV